MVLTARERRLGNPHHKVQPVETALLVEPAVEDGVLPDPLGPLGTVGTNLWEEILSTSPWLSRSDLPLVQLLAETADERTVVRVRALKEHWEWRRQVQLRQVDAQYAALLIQVGATPKARRQLALAEVKAIDAVDVLIDDALGSEPKVEKYIEVVEVAT
jgi:hypothetical protein